MIAASFAAAVVASNRTLKRQHTREQTSCCPTFCDAQHQNPVGPPTCCAEANADLRTHWQTRQPQNKAVLPRETIRNILQCFALRETCSKPAGARFYSATPADTRFCKIMRSLARITRQSSPQPPALLRHAGQLRRAARAALHPACAACRWCRRMQT